MSNFLTLVRREFSGTVNKDIVNLKIALSFFQKRLDSCRPRILAFSHLGIEDSVEQFSTQFSSNSKKTIKTMSNIHLAAGSQHPPRVDGKVRLYGMKFCPFTQRVKLVLSYKNIPHDVVHINLKNKPEWYSEVHPDGKVPALVDLNGKVITDSTVIANHLEDKYPEPTLYNEETRSKDLQLCDHYDKIVRVFSNCIHKKDKRSLEEIVQEISSYLVDFEEELKKRNTVFFTGTKPGLLDILMWPFVERAKSLPIICKEPLNFDKEKFPRIMDWIDSMKTQDFVVENVCSPETFAKVVEASDSGKVDFDNI